MTHKKYSECPKERERDKRKKKRRLEFLRAYIERYKLSHGCSICGYNKCAKALDFHHTDPSKKSYKPASLVQKTMTRFHIEISKCVLLCSNCHAEIHEDMEIITKNKVVKIDKQISIFESIS